MQPSVKVECSWSLQNSLREAELNSYARYNKKTKQMKEL